jgi:NAD(P)-dependent dehydrogenase (short-subunit alcohol dehydrogenase family)
MKPKSKFILITGTSTGLGYGIAKELINRGYSVFGSVRKQEDGDRVKSELGDQFIPLIFDVTDQPAIDKAVETVKARLNGQGLGALINNSGISVSGPIEHLDIERVKQNFDVNVLGIFRVTKAFLHLLGTQLNHPSAPGRILNMSSIAGKMAPPYMAPYVGSKHAVEGVSHCLRRELLPFGIEVVIIGPGAVQTPIWDKGNLDEYKTTRYIKWMARFFGYFVSRGKQGIPLDVFSNRVADILETEKPKTRYTIIKSKFKRWTLPLMLPDRLVDGYFQKTFMN